MRNKIHSHLEEVDTLDDVDIDDDVDTELEVETLKKKSISIIKQTKGKFFLSGVKKRTPGNV